MLYVSITLQEAGETLVCKFESNAVRLRLTGIVDGLEVATALHERVQRACGCSRASGVATIQSLTSVDQVRTYLGNVRMSGGLEGLRNGGVIRLTYVDPYGEPFWLDTIETITVGTGPYNL